MNKLLIVASGPSANQVKTNLNVLESVDIMVVNGASTWMPFYKYFFTLDPSPINLEYIRNAISLKAQVHLALPEKDLIEFKDFDNVHTYERFEKRGVEPEDKDSPEWWFWRWRCVKKLSDDPMRIHSGNSAYGALNVGYLLGYTDIGIIGVDASNEARVEGGKPNNLSHLPLLFESACKQVSIVNLGYMKSKLKTANIKDWV